MLFKVEAHILNRAAQTLADIFQIRDRCVLKGQQKLLAAHAPDNIIAARNRFQTLGELLKHEITGRMAVSVIDFFEVVNVEQDNGKFAFFLLILLNKPVHGLHQRAAVTHLRQLVGHGDFVQFAPIGETLQRGNHFGIKDNRLDRLGQIVIGTIGQTFGNAARVVQAADHNHRQIALRAGTDFFQHFKAVHIRHNQIKQDKRDILFDQHIKRLEPIGGKMASKTMTAQAAMQDFLIGRIVIHNQNFAIADFISDFKLCINRFHTGQQCLNRIALIDHMRLALRAAIIGKCPVNNFHQLQSKRFGMFEIFDRLRRQFIFIFFQNDFCIAEYGV